MKTQLLRTVAAAVSPALIAILSLCLSGTARIRADDATGDVEQSPTAAPAASSTETKHLVVFDGGKIGENAKGWTSAGSGKAAIEAQDKEERTTGRKAVSFHAEGTAFVGGGWNWFGWWPQDGGTNVSGFKNLRFWAKLTGDTQPTLLTVTLIANNKEKRAGDACNILQYCPGLGDGKWHEIAIPLADLNAKQGVDLSKAWELMIGSWSQGAVNYTLYLDEIAFEGTGDPAQLVATTAPAAQAATSSSPATVASAAATPLSVQIDATDPNIRYIGRWDLSKAAAPRASWTYSLVTARFKGTAVNARLKGAGGFYQITVDGQPTQTLAIKEGTDLYEIAKGLPDAEHTVEIIRRTEGAWIAPLTFLGFQLEQGSQLVPLPPRSDRRILIGDSISCGYGNEATRDEGNPPGKENGYLTYGPIAARKLGAEVQVIAWSGRKLFPDNTMVEVYPRTLAMDTQPQADLKAWTPGVVVIDLGTNDFRELKHPPDEQGWIAAYKDFIKTIRGTAPDSYVFVASGPMGTDPNWDKWAKTVVADLQQAGDRRIAYLPFATQDINHDGIGGHWHPNLITHHKMAERLTQEIEKAVGWK